MLTSDENEQRRRTYAEVRARIAELLRGEDDWIAALSTLSCELFHTSTGPDSTVSSRRTYSSSVRIKAVTVA
jgi:putative methionine-R-sulfoxide reductase with GAF domain